MSTVNQDHIPSELIAHQIRSAAACELVLPLMEWATERGGLTTEIGPIDVPVRIVWGDKDLILPYPAAADGFREKVPNAEWVVLENVGHCPQLDVPEETARLILEVSSPQ
jgi:pimeloyl-ACP methyl ester carboxylesterase